MANEYLLLIVLDRVPRSRNHLPETRPRHRSEQMGHDDEIACRTSGRIVCDTSVDDGGEHRRGDLRGGVGAADRGTSEYEMRTAERDLPAFDAKLLIEASERCDIGAPDVTKTRRGIEGLDEEVVKPRDVACGVAGVDESGDRVVCTAFEAEGDGRVNGAPHLARVPRAELRWPSRRSQGGHSSSPPSCHPTANKSASGIRKIKGPTSHGGRGGIETGTLGACGDGARNPGTLRRHTWREGTRKEFKFLKKFPKNFFDTPNYQDNFNRNRKRKRSGVVILAHHLTDGSRSTDSF